MSRIPDRPDKLTVNGVLTEQSYNFLEQWQQALDNEIELFYRVKGYDSLTLLSDDAVEPADNTLALLKDGQGLAIYREDLGIWVKASDGVTPIV